MRLSTRESDVWLLLTNGLLRSSIDVNFTIAWRPKMPYMPIQSMKTMHHVLQLDGKLIRYGVSWMLAIATSMIGVVAYA